MIDYPYNTPRILTDALYTFYGGRVGESSLGQRQAAFLIAEKRMTSHLGTFLPVTTVTGTYPWPLGGSVFVTEHSHIRSINAVKVLHAGGLCDCSLQSEDGCGFVYDDTYGYIMVADINSCVHSCGCVANPFQFQVSYTCGLGSGSCYQADMLAALTIVGEISLMEMIDPGFNEGVGDVGIQQFSNQSYSEVRVKLKRTALGTSARANYAAGLVSNYRHFRALKMG